MSLLGRLRTGLRRTAAELGARLDDLLGRDQLAARDPAREAETVDALEEILLQADVGVTATARIIDGIREDRSSAAPTGLRELVKREILQILNIGDRACPNGPSPRVVLVVGVNGTGKTTTVGKLARLMREDGHRPLILRG